MMSINHFQLKSNAVVDVSNCALERRDSNYDMNKTYSDEVRVKKLPKSSKKPSSGSSFRIIGCNSKSKESCNDSFDIDDEKINSTPERTLKHTDSLHVYRDNKRNNTESSSSLCDMKALHRKETAAESDEE
jgi:hypothetical protein